jgi:hypothetical protein
MVVTRATGFVEISARLSLLCYTEANPASADIRVLFFGSVDGEALSIEGWKDLD